MNDAMKIRELKLQVNRLKSVILGDYLKKLFPKMEISLECSEETEPVFECGGKTYSVDYNCQVWDRYTPEPQVVELAGSELESHLEYVRSRG